MKSKSYAWVAPCLLGSALFLPPTILGAEKDLMKDDKGMMKDEKAMPKDQKGTMKEREDAKMKDKTKTEKTGKGAMADEKMKVGDKMKMEEKKK